MKYLISSLLLSFFTFSQAQDTLFFDSYDPDNDNVVGDTTYTFTPKNNTVYSLVVDGTYSAWENFFYTSPCGPTEFPTYPSPGVPGSAGHRVNFDMEHAFAYPTTSLCNSLGIPDSTDRIQISLDNGSTWFHPLSSNSLNSNHIYNYEITGQGNPLMIRQESPRATDDHGQLRFVFREKSPIGIKENTTSNAFSIFPNPVSDKLYLSFDDLKIISLRLTNINGQLIIEKEEVNNTSVDVDVNSIEDGVYIVESLLEDGSVLKERVLINH